ncbi:MAG: STM4012 family radical SAM protein [Acidobacteria bacterium]|nr:STM4012 family radical SAM protein [Acidobacteriota bacterium]
MTSISSLLEQIPYEAYSYSYPHKTAYRPLDPPVSLREIWAGENRRALFLYIHIPFCEMRCGFCNLFTTANPSSEVPHTYLSTLNRQAIQVQHALGPASFARLAFGGGTPTYLNLTELETLFDLVETIFGVDPHQIPTSIETSPLTAETAKLQFLRNRGVDRISLGIQSFVESEVAAVGRRQKNTDVFQAIDRISHTGFPTRNLDLIYGLPGQTVQSWLFSLQTALRFSPEELYLYPLYVRSLTGLGRKEQQWNDIRLTCYREGRDLLLSAGYQQCSMRMFRAPGAPKETGPVYCCQEDGMVGLGCGARSYTQTVHYSNQYAVDALAIRSILAEYVQQPDSTFAQATYGIRLTAEDQRRRFVIQSLLQTSGLEVETYRNRFGSNVFEELPELKLLLESGLAFQNTGTIQLSADGLERSDLIGPWLYSRTVKTLIKTAHRR